MGFCRVFLQTVGSAVTSLVTEVWAVTGAAWERRLVCMQAHSNHLLLGQGPSHRRDNAFPSFYRFSLGGHCVSHTVLGPGTLG